MPEALTLTFADFKAVLQKLDAYLLVKFSKYTAAMPFEDPDYVPPENYGHDTPDTGHVPATATDLSDIAVFIWQCLEAGAKEVDRIHDELFMDAQIAFFNEYCIQKKDYFKGAYSIYNSPIDLFLKLGKPAQLKIVNDGLLAKAVYQWQGEQATGPDFDVPVKQPQKKRRKPKTG